MTAKPTVDWYFDIISPFAYLQASQLDRLLPSVEIRPKPVLLGAILSHWGQVGPAEIPAKRRHTYRMCIWTARQRGLPFHMPPRHPFNPLPALRLLAGTEPDLAMAQRALAFVFAQGRAPDDETGLTALALELGLAGDATQMASEQTAKDRLRANTEEAIGRGVFGVPTLCMDGECMWGDDATTLFEAFLADRGMFETSPWNELDSVDVGIERRRS